MTVIPIHQPGTCCAISDDTAYVASGREINYYNFKGEKVGSFPKFTQNIVFLDLTKMHVVVGVGTKIQLWKRDVSIIDLEDGEEIKPEFISETEIAHTCIACLVHCLVVSSKGKITTLNPETKKSVSVEIGYDKDIKALASHKEGFISGDKTGVIKYWPDVSFSQKSQKIAKQEKSIDALITQGATLFALTGQTIVTFNLENNTPGMKYSLKFQPIKMIALSDSILVLGKQELYLPTKEGQTLAIPITQDHSGDYKDIAYGNNVIIVAGKTSSFFYLEPQNPAVNTRGWQLPWPFSTFF